ncbi:MAG: LuxR C-terminal-related transcriptional regulator [Aquisalimonadaceae bacterium]
MPATRTPTVFVIDPDPRVRRTLDALFTSVHLRARYYETADACVRDQTTGDYGCLLADVAATGVGGAAFMKWQRHLGTGMPVIFLSDSGDVLTAVEAMKAGAWDFLEKPFNGQALLDAIHAALEQSRIATSRHALCRELQSRFDSLTPREREVVVPMVQGLSNREIAELLRVSPKTVEVYRSRIMRKTRADNLCGLIRMAIRVGVLEEEPSDSGHPDIPVPVGGFSGSTD